MCALFVQSLQTLNHTNKHMWKEGSVLHTKKPADRMIYNTDSRVNKVTLVFHLSTLITVKKNGNKKMVKTDVPLM